MSDASSTSNASGGVFVRGFLPGLILGAVGGLLIGYVASEFTGQKKLDIPEGVEGGLNTEYDSRAMERGDAPTAEDAEGAVDEMTEGVGDGSGEESPTEEPAAESSGG